MYKLKTIHLVIFILSISISSNGNNFNASGVYDVRSYGAVGDGLTDDAANIQKAIDEASKNGGGKVLIQNGIFLSSTIILKSNIELYLAGNAILLGYPKDFRRYFKDDFFLYKKMSRALIYAIGASNISINSFTANWASVSGTVSYRLDVSTNNTFTSILASYNNLSVSGTSHAVTGLSGNRTYYYRVYAVDNPGSSLGYSSINTVKTLKKVAKK